MIETPYRSTLPPVVAYELKTCELCERNFTRQRGTQEKYCQQCSARNSARYEPAPTPERKTKKQRVQKLKPPRQKPIVPRTDPARELRNAWMKSAADGKADPVEELRDAWQLR